MIQRLLLAVLALATAPAGSALTEAVRVERSRVVVSFEPQAMSDAAMHEFADLADRGVRDIVSFLRSGPGGAPLAMARIHFRVSARAWIAQTTRRGILLPLGRVRDREAPYLHETVHMLLPGRDASVWLQEGFASFVESHVAEHIGGYDAQVFNRGGNQTVDQAAARHARTPYGRAALAHVGGTGVPPGFYRDRRRAAAPFYVLSQSFVKFLVHRVGLHRVVDLFAERDVPRALHERTGRGLDDWKRDWLATLASSRLWPTASRTDPLRQLSA